MAARLVFVETERSLPSLHRGWRTPDPSPTRDAAGLPTWNVKLCIDVCPEEEAFAPAVRSAAAPPTGSSSRTPSPSPMRQHPPLEKGCSKLGIGDSLDEPLEDRIPTPRMQLLVMTNPPSATSCNLDGKANTAQKKTENTKPLNMRNFFTPRGRSTTVPSGWPWCYHFRLANRFLPVGSFCGKLGRGINLDELLEDQMPISRMQVLEGTFPLSATNFNLETKANAALKKTEDTRPPKMPKPENPKQQETSLAERLADDSENIEAHDMRSELMPAMSVGSRGHPFTCAPACKFALKKRGCKDGAACSHCHLCKYIRIKSKAKRVPDIPPGVWYRPEV